MRDPTHGRIDADIQRAVDAMHPPGIGERVAWENTLQSRRDASASDLIRNVPSLDATPFWPVRMHRHLLTLHRHPEWRGHPRPDRWHVHVWFRHDHRPA